MAQAVAEVPGSLRKLPPVVASGVWVFLLLSVVSFSATDWPSPAVWPWPATQNWCGKIGAFAAYYFVRHLGLGVWVFLAATGVALILSLAKVTITDLWLRATGVLVLLAATAAVADHLSLQTFGLPQGDGGNVGIAAHTYLITHFGPIGSRLILLFVVVVGLVLVADELLVRWPLAALGILQKGADVGMKLPGIASRPAPKQAKKPASSGWKWPSLGEIFAGRPALAGLGSRSSSSSEDEADSGPRINRRTPAKKSANRYGDDEGEHLGDVPELEQDVSDELALEDAAGDEEDESEELVDEAEEAAEDEQAEEEADESSEEVEEAVAEEPKRDLSKIKVKLPNSIKPRQTAPPPPQELGEYELPQWDELAEAETGFAEQQEAYVREKAAQLEGAFEEFGVEARVTEIDTGPVITMYEIAVNKGTKVSAITSLSTDIARALAAESIRVVAPIPGKNTIGIEVPNAEKEKVRLKELLQLAPAKTQKMHIPLFLGKDSSGEPLITDLAAMPHCLIAGTTGSGKSVCINTVIMSIMYTQRPDMVKLILVDPKVVEMAPFKDIPHLMCPVITDASKATSVLEWCCVKMDERYELLAEAGVRNIAGYNKLTPEELIERFNPSTPEEEAKIPKRLPYMVVIIDELADLMMTSGKEVESHIVRIAQKARAVGIHLILATQRPQANVVTGLIKSNMPSKIAFRVASKMDSRIVLDQNGAELLLGQGDMLFLPPGASKPTRSQGTFIDDGEIRLSVKKVKELAEAQYEPELVQIKNGISVGGDEERDPLYEDAVRVVLETRRGSVSLLQRRLTIGYARASRIIEQMAADGIVGDYKGSQAREATLTIDEWEELKAQQEAAGDDGYEEEEDADVVDEDSDADADDFEDDDDAPRERDVA